MENITEKKEDTFKTSKSLDKILEIPLLTHKKLALKDILIQNKDLSVKHANIKKTLSEKEKIFSLKEKEYNKNREKVTKEYQNTMKENHDRQVFLEEKIKKKEKKIEQYDLQIKEFKLTIEDMHKRITKANSDVIEKEKCLNFLNKFQKNTTGFVQLDIFDRMETIFNSREFIKKKKDKLKEKINTIKTKIKDTEKKNNLTLKNKETECKDLKRTAEQIAVRENEIKTKLKENINEHNKKALLLYKIYSCVDNFLNRFVSFLPELRHYNLMKEEEKLNLEKKAKIADLKEGAYEIELEDFYHIEEDIIKKFDVIYKYIRDTIHIINKVKKEITLKEESQVELVKNDIGIVQNYVYTHVCTYV
ncbi:conserved protein, unknown function [Hepatocystis sp. ex Piliocolobus tephrosceles]|nr:conserved protein, unknown function [Hepatocystis sp. ex Piliocolobus tephrosceles]